MSIVKAVGRIAEYRGNSCRVEVISFRKDGSNITDRSEIKSQFPPNGYVFAPKFFDTFQFELDTIVEFTTSNYEPSLKGENLDTVLMDVNKPCRQSGFRIFDLPSTILFNELSINQPQLKFFIHDEPGIFYIKVENFLYGPFRNINGDVLPKSGTVVNKYKFSSGVYSIEDRAYLLFEPEEIVAQVDCMNQTQLATFFKEQLRNVLVDVDFNQIKKVLETQPLQGLALARTQRILANLEAVSLTHGEVKSLINLSGDFRDFYQSAIEEVNEEMKSELITPLLNEKNKLEQSVNVLTANVKRLKKEEEACVSTYERIRRDYEFLSQEKERLVNDIRTHALIEDRKEKKIDLITYEEQLMCNRSKNFSSLDKFIEQVNDSIHSNENGNGKYVHKIIHQFKDYKCFLCKDIRLVLQIAKLSNNCRVIIQQVEPDWLKFEKLYHNGLEHIWRCAHNDPQLLHFFILEDLNIASIECYGRPLLDLVKGVRKKLPSTDLPWPDNLWIFGSPIMNVSEDFGLPLIEKTFEDWAGFPINDSISIDIEVSSEMYLLPAQLKEHSVIPGIEKSQYFLSR